VGLYEAQNDIITKVSYGIIDNKRKTLKLAHKKGLLERFISNGDSISPGRIL
jgi:hypothetical protein